MKRIVCCIHLVVLLYVIQLTACNPGTGKGSSAPVDTAAIKRSIADAPVLSPEESMKRMQLEDGFEIRLVAAEPLVTAPVAIKFDERGRIWVCEMMNYMPDTLGTGEDQPTGRIVILEDTNGDGLMDRRKVFMDGLVLPRALCLVEGGILVAEPPNLWYIDIRNDKPGKRVLVDPTYAAGGNPEHQANGLIYGLDNWIYSADCDSRYKKKGSKWLIERTHSRGQWGISQDNDGRLYYNHNSANLLGDYFLPKLGAGNTDQKNIAGYQEEIVRDKRVYPLRPTPGVNRGYMEGILDDSLKLRNFTAASGPVIYRGDLFGKAYQSNAFVGEPAGNLIKRNILEETGYRVQGRQAYEGTEFLSSRDERFRPVTLYGGPDGALYVVDMYRGIIQHKTYLTGYLKEEIKSRQLTEPLTCGRIYKIVPIATGTNRYAGLPTRADSLVNLLQHPNGWVRDKAQQLIVERRLTQVIPSIKQQLKRTNNPLLVNHALWTLEGLDALSPDDISPLLTSANWKFQVQSLTALPSVITKTTLGQYLPLLNQLVEKKDTLIAPYLAFITGTIKQFDSVAANKLALNIAVAHPNSVYVADAIISNINGTEETFAKQVSLQVTDRAMAINKSLNTIITNIQNGKTINSEALKKDFPKGLALYNAVCQTCHGAEGNGIKTLAPPLRNSDWVVGDKNRLIKIVLYGLTGPVTVNKKVYKAPEITGEMPGIGNNTDYSDEDIAQVLSLIRKSWSNNADKVKAEEVTDVRRKLSGRQKAFTTDELNKNN
ncbi:dehydrogenase [Segetibacter sp. 3557_3]|nr:dehydrogenase [Segetibacter sp. 3557_3]